MDVTAHRGWGDASRPAAPAPCDLLPRRGQRAAGCSAVRVPCSVWCGFAVAGRWSGALVAERRSAEQAHATRRADGTRVRTACMPLGCVGVRRRVCHVQLRGGVRAWRGGCREAKKRAPHACLCRRGSRLAPRRERGATHCVCVRHTARRTLRGVQLARQGPGAGGGREREPARDATRAVVSSASASSCSPG